MSLNQSNKMGQLEQKGWEIIKSKNLDQTKLLRNKIYKIVKKVFKIKENDPEKGINLLHKYCKGITETQINTKKLSIISQISKDKSLVDIIFNLWGYKIKELIGNDILVQKLLNVVIQSPKDKNYTTPHRDAPPNSFFEIITWIPLVNCKKTKSMWLYDLDNTKKILKKQEKNPKQWNNSFKNFKKEYVDVKFGECLLFLPGLYHGSDINKTEETRISLNTRFESLFSPSKRKFPVHFFRLHKISKITKLGIEQTKAEYLK